MKYLTRFSLTLLTVAAACRPLAAQPLQSLALPAADPPPYQAAACGAGTPLVVAGPTRLFVLPDGGISWRPAWQAPAREGSIVRIACAGPVLHLLTSRALYRVDDPWAPPERLFPARQAPSSPLLAFASSRDGRLLAIGSVGCFFLSRSGGAQWVRMPAGRPTEPIGELLLTNRSGLPLFLASAQRVYLWSADSRGARCIFEAPVSEIEDPEDAAPSEDLQGRIEAQRPAHALQLAADRRARRLWVGTRRGVYESVDIGPAFKRVDGGPPGTEISDLLFTPSTGLLAATPQGLFALKPEQERLRALAGPLAAAPVTALAAHRGAPVAYAATPRELYPIDGASARTPWFDPERAGSAVLADLFRHEPRVQELYPHAIRAAEISLKTLKRWRARSALSTLLPQLSLGWDNSVSTNIDLDRAGTTQADVFIEGPIDRDHSLDLSLTWDLGRLVWSSEERYIAGLARWYVEHREEILSEINRLYFERRKVLLEAAAPHLSQAQAVSRWLAVDELTARLDALTGNYFSERIAPLHDLYQELMQRSASS